MSITVFLCLFYSRVPDHPVHPDGINFTFFILPRPLATNLQSIWSCNFDFNAWNASFTAPVIMGANRTAKFDPAFFFVSHYMKENLKQIRHHAISTIECYITTLYVHSTNVDSCWNLFKTSDRLNSLQLRRKNEFKKAVHNTQAVPNLLYVTDSHVHDVFLEICFLNKHTLIIEIMINTSTLSKQMRSTAIFFYYDKL